MVVIVLITAEISKIRFFCNLSMRDHVIGVWTRKVDLPIHTLSTLVSLLPGHGCLWIDNSRRYVALIAFATRLPSHLHV